MSSLGGRTTTNARSRRASTTAASGLVGLMALSHLGSDLMIGAFGALLPRFQARFALSSVEIGALVAVLSVTSSFAQPLAGRVVDRVGARDLAALGGAATSAVLAIAVVAPSFPLLVALAAVGGLSTAVYHPAGAAIVRRTSIERGGLALSVYGAGGALGLALGPILGFALADRYGTSHAAWLLIPGVAACLLVRARVPADSVRASSRQAKADVPRESLVPLRPFVVSITLIALAATAFNTAIPFWLAEQARGDLAGWALGTYAAAAAAGGLIAAASTRRVRPHLLVSVTPVVAIVPFVAVVSLPPGTRMWFAMIVAAGALAHAGTPIQLAVAQDRTPSAVAAASGVVMGLPIGLAGLLYLPLSALGDPVGHAAIIGAAAMGLVPAAAAAAVGLREGTDAAGTTAVGCCGCAVGQPALAG